MPARFSPRRRKPQAGRAGAETAHLHRTYAEDPGAVRGPAQPRALAPSLSLERGPRSKALPRLPMSATPAAPTVAAPTVAATMKAPAVEPAMEASHAKPAMIEERAMKVAVVKTAHTENADKSGAVEAVRVIIGIRRIGVVVPIPRIGIERLELHPVTPCRHALQIFNSIGAGHFRRFRAGRGGIVRHRDPCTSARLAPSRPLVAAPRSPREEPLRAPPSEPAGRGSESFRRFREPGHSPSASG